MRFASGSVFAEFCATSITSLSLPQARINAALPFNPHIRYGRSDQRGYMRLKLTPQELRAQIRVVDNALDPASGIATAAQFVVDAQRPGARAA